MMPPRRACYANILAVASPQMNDDHEQKKWLRWRFGNSRWFWFLLGMMVWGCLWCLGANMLGVHITHHILSDMLAYIVMTLIMTLVFQYWIRGFPSDWPPFLWFFFPLAALIATAISALVWH